MPDHERPTPDDRAELIEAVDDNHLPWEVDDWRYESGKYEESRLTLDVTWNVETGEFDADVISTGSAAEQRERIKNVKGLVEQIEAEREDGAPVQDVARVAVSEMGMAPAEVHHEIDSLRTKGEVYEPKQGNLRTT